MVRRSLLTIVAVLLVIVGCVVVSTSAGAVVDSAIIVSSPSPGPTTNFLSSVSCLNASSCIAVGETDEGVGNAPLVLKWDGASWAQVASPDPGGFWELLSVSCVSSMSCAAVGRYNNDLDSSSETFATTWNGESWTRATTPNVGPEDNRLESVSCTSVSSCVAVGYYKDAGVSKTLVLEWNGVLWTRASSPNHGVGSNELDSVSCVTATFCAAVGSNAENGLKTLVLVGNGSTWTEVPSPNPSAGMNRLYRVSCVSATWCAAVGYTYTDVVENLVLVWDGSTWERVSSPNPSTTENVLNSVSCASAVSCVAVGNYIDNEFVVRASVLSWDGFVWSVVSSPSLGTVGDTLSSVSCASEFLCNAVGNSESGSVMDSLALLLTGPEPLPTTTTTATVATDPVVPAFTS